MARIPLSLAIGAYDHVRDLLNGAISPEGIELLAHELAIEEVTFRFTRFAEWDACELSFGKTVALLAQDDPQLVPIPVFPSRVFRHSAIYVPLNSSLKDPRELEGKRVGIPEWAQTAGIYVRGLLQHEYGVDLCAVDWVQAGVREPGRGEKVALRLPPGLKLTPMPDKSLSQMLAAGELDAVISARAPQNARRLLADCQALELAYWKKTRIFPIMHVVVLRKDVYQRNRWIAMNLLKAFEQAKNRSLARIADMAASHYPLPWLADHATISQAMLGSDYWPYGIEPNRTTLEAFALYAFEQGVSSRKLAVESLFVPEVQSSFKV
jgi:4,5-dihydroxyphthalate decarboxylase